MRANHVVKVLRNARAALRDFERKKCEEEERKENEAEALSNCDRNRLLHRSSFGVFRLSSG